MIEVHCPKCGESFRLKKYHNGPRCRKCNITYRYRCLECLKDYRGLDALRFHIKGEHLFIHQSDAAHYECDICGKRFKYQESLLGHRKRICLNSAVLRCDHCDFVTKYKPSIARHIQIRHMGIKFVKSHVCDKCSFKFINGESLEKHRLNCMGAYTCDRCDGKFRSKLTLIEHIKTKEIE